MRVPIFLITHVWRLKYFQTVNVLVSTGSYEMYKVAAIVMYINIECIERGKKVKERVKMIADKWPQAIQPPFHSHNDDYNAHTRQSE